MTLSMILADIDTMTRALEVVFLIAMLIAALAYYFRR